MTIDNVFNQTWEVGKKNCAALIGFGFANLLSSFINRAGNEDLIKIMKKITEGDLQGTKAIQALTSTFSGTECVTLLITFLLSSFITLVLYRFVKNAINEDSDTSFSELINSSAKGYGMFLLKYIPYAVLYTVVIQVPSISLLIDFVFPYNMIIKIAILCLSLICVYLLVRLAFVNYIAANEPELNIKETFAKSMKLTKGRFWKLLGYGIISCLIACSGLLLCGIGVLFTIPLSSVFLGVVYDELTNETES